MQNCVESTKYRIIEYSYCLYIKYFILGLIKPRDCIKWMYMLAGIQD